MFISDLINTAAKRGFFEQWKPRWNEFSGLSVSQCFGRLGFNPRPRLTKDTKMVLDTSLLNTQQYKVRIKGKKWSNLGKGVAHTPTPQGSIF